MSVYKFLQADYVELDSFFMEVDWSVLLAEKDINNMIQAFYDKLFEGIDLFVPRKIVRDDKLPKWFDKPLRQLIGQKNKLYHKFKKKTTKFTQISEEKLNIEQTCVIYFTWPKQNF